MGPLIFISPVALEALIDLCKASGLEDAVVMIYGSAEPLPLTKSVDRLLAERPIDLEKVKHELSLFKGRISAGSVELRVDCVPGAGIPREHVSQIHGIAINARVTERPDPSALTLDYRHDKFCLLNPDGSDALERITY